MRDLHQKLVHLSPTRKPSLARGCNTSVGLLGLQPNDFLSKIQPLFPYLRRNFDRARRNFREGSETCQEHLINQCSLAANPEIINTSISAPSLTSISVFKETLLCFRKYASSTRSSEGYYHPIRSSSGLPTNGTPDCFFQGLQLIPLPGNMDYLYCGAYIFLGSVFDVAMNFSFTLASEVLLTLEFVITSIRIFLSGSLCQNGKDTCIGFSKEVVPFLCNKLGSYAKKLLTHKCDKDDVDGSLKTKVRGNDPEDTPYLLGELPINYGFIE
ncbi:hypothetical protein OROMI_014736 [Orobanche minor]